MEIVGFVLALCIGISLGLIGGGGSILTVPVLVYVLGIDAVLATAYSLFVVGVSALVGAWNNWRKGLVSVRTAVVFAIPAFLGVYFTRLLLVPALPDPLFSCSMGVISKSMGLMLLFSLIMLVAAISMLRKRKKVPEYDALKFNYPMIGVEGLLVGVLTGVVGAGGGFLIVPALVLFARLPMKLAVGTSLSIIAVKSLLGFVGDLQAGQEIDWRLLLLFSGLSVLGIFIGGKLSNRIPGQKLKKGFVWFVLIMAVVILFRELF